MDKFRNKYAIITVRTILGLFLLFSGAMGLLAGDSTEGVPPEMIAPFTQLRATGIIQMIKTTEAIAGFMLLFNLLPALAALFIAPIAIGIIVFHAHIMPMGLIAGTIVGLLNAYLGYAYWDKYKAIFNKA